MKKYLLSALMILSFSTLADDEVLDCDNPMNTIQINQCAAIKLETAQAQLVQYLKASLTHNANDPELVEAIKAAQKDWQAYMTAHCNAVYTQWREGTIRGVMAISCKTELTEQRTHELWQNFLTYMDSTPAVLPEPKH
ncbi:lysozyme inhibitor LprI family protein [Photobacterium damselae]|uniref:lysozyme inhibitor LprI family protein n=1 Tax=Photobacterium damselae TaxID=38293 RepID=UPI001302AC84|nr:lysozyme inhibitor LprI family protein [Photobacterium damselae]